MKTPIHTVLGASGATGQAVMQELENRGLRYRAVGRSAETSNGAFTRADLLHKTEAHRAIADSDYVYLCVGLPYNSKLWEKAWPQLMRHVIEGCERARAKLIFFDNVYMYGPAPLAVPFDEMSPQNPTTKKGIARKKTADLLLQAIADQRIEGLIGRSADFYGPEAVNSSFYISFLENMLKGKAPQTLGEKDVLHTYAYSSDNGRALVALALNEQAYGHVWHLPVGPPVTLDDVNAMLNAELETNFKLALLPRLVRKILGLFIPIIREVEEMRYQFEQPYVMSFEKFKKAFPDFQVTPYPNGIAEMVRGFREE